MKPENMKLIKTKHLIGFVAVCIACMCTFCTAPDHPYALRLDTVRTGYSPGAMWTQAYIAPTKVHRPDLIVTMSTRLSGGIDNYGNLYACKSSDMGRSWSAPKMIMERTVINDSLEMVLSDVYPTLHKPSGKVLGTGKLFYYNTNNQADPEIARAVGYTVYHPANDAWSALKLFEMPAVDHQGDSIYNPSAGCNQPLHLPDGTLLLPVYYLRENIPEGLNVATIVHCAFDGDSLRYLAHGDELTMPSGRGLGETSIALYDGEYFITLRNDESAYVAKGNDGLHYGPVQEWTFDDGQILGSYNTQTHWITHSSGLYLVYTRRGANNDHIFRHRAPLFAARVHPAALQVMRDTERVLVPERGARLGNFGVAQVGEDVTVVSAAERMTEHSAEYGANNTVFVATMEWNND
jgi:hypothetical protein